MASLATTAKPKRGSPPPHRFVARVVRLHPDTPAEATTWPWPFHVAEDQDSAAWKARYAPDRLTRDDLYELADIANAYETMITHPCRSVAEKIHDLRRVFKALENG